MSLFFGPKESSSYCALPGEHAPGSGSFNYALYNSDANGGQGGWYWCNKCQSLFYGGASRTAGVCDKDFNYHNGSSSDTYYLFYFSKTI